MSQLLVSVQDATEAHVAAAAGADFVDLKNPQRGSLGIADAPVLTKFLEVMSAFPDTPLSAALGEISDEPESLDQFRETLSLSDRCPDFLKLGLAGSRHQPDWREKWRSIRQSVNAAAKRSIRWIGVIYADADRAESPPINDILVEAAAAGCYGILVDTFCKQSGRLTEVWSAEEFQTCRTFCSEHKLHFAVAGRLRRSDLNVVCESRPNIIAVRSAVCRNEDRRNEIDGEKIRVFRQCLLQM